MNRGKKIVCAALAAAMIASGCLSAAAATEKWNDASANAGVSAEWSAWKTEWEAVQNDYEKIALTVGKTETELNFGWYSHTADNAPVVRLSPAENMTGAQTFTGTQSPAKVQNGVQYYANKVTVTGLKENSTYYYTYVSNGVESSPVKYTTGSFSNFSVLYVGDPQIGACSGQTASDSTGMTGLYAARNDSFNWNQTLQMALSKNPDVSFMLSAGDQINNTGNGEAQEYEYAGFLNPSVLRSLPLSTAIGNHDSKFANYSNHFNNPNTFTDDQTLYTTGRTTAGTDYYYTYGDALFIVIDTNNVNCATHEAVIKKAVEENKDKKWRIVMFHQDIYGSGYDHSDSDGIVLRTQLTPIFDTYEIDVALQGHDHTYSRTYQLTGDGETHQSYTKSPVRAGDSAEKKADYLQQNDCYNIVSDQQSGQIIDPKGTVYIEANSATGSKFYNLIAQQQDYIAERSQTWTPSYAVISMTSNSFTITTYDALTGEMLAGSTPYTIVKSADKTALKALIGEVEALLENAASYTDETVAALREALTAATKAVEQTDASDEDVGTAYAVLSNAKAALALKADSPSSEVSSDTSSVVSGNSSKEDSAGEETPATGGSDSMVILFAVLALLCGTAMAAILRAEKKKVRE